MFAYQRHVLGLLCILLALTPAPAAADLALITHPGNAHDRLSLNAARRMFSMQLSRWPDGTPVRVFVLADNTPQHQAFAKDLLRLFPRQLRRVWDRQLYSGTGQAPDRVVSESEMLRRVAETPGAIGYISSENLDESVQILSVY